MARAVRALGPPAEVNKRNDIVVDGFKIRFLVLPPLELSLISIPISPFGTHVSGSAYKIVNKRAYHHGTMLIDAELGSLGDLLSNIKVCLSSTVQNHSPCFTRASPHHQDGMHTKGVDSVRSPVRNLRHFTPDISHESFVKSVAREFTIVYGGHEEVGGDFAFHASL